MGHAGLDPQTASEFLPTLIYWVAWFLAGLALLGLSAYAVLLLLEMFSSQPRSKTRPAKLSQATHPVPQAEENRDLSAAQVPISAAPEPPAKEASRVPPRPRDPQIRTTAAHVTLPPEPPLEFEG